MRAPGFRLVFHGERRRKRHDRRGPKTMNIILGLKALGQWFRSEGRTRRWRLEVRSGTPQAAWRGGARSVRAVFGPGRVSHFPKRRHGSSTRRKVSDDAASVIA